MGAASLLAAVAREAGATYRTTWRLVPDDDGTMTTLRFEIGATNVSERSSSACSAADCPPRRATTWSATADLARATEQAKGG